MMAKGLEQGLELSRANCGGAAGRAVTSAKHASQVSRAKMKTVCA